MKREFLHVDDFIKNHSYIDYCEIIIAPDGKVSYAVPSHQEMLIDLTTQRHNITRDKLWGIVPIQADAMEWLMYFSGGYIPAWSYGFYMYSNETSSQKETIRKLNDANLVSMNILNKNYDYRYNFYCNSDEFRKYL